MVVTDLAAEIEGLAERYPDRAEAIVKITVAAQSGGPSRAEMMQDLRKMFPRSAMIDFERPEPVGNDAPRTGVRGDADYRETARNYLVAKLTGHPDAVALSALAETFLAPTEARL